MTESRGRWAAAGVVTMVAGLATSYATAMTLTIRESPVVAVAEMIIKITPGPLAETLISIVGQLDKPLLVLGIVLSVLGLGAMAGVLSRDGSTLKPMLVWFAVAGLGAAAVLAQPGASLVDVLPVLVGLVTWVAVLPALTKPLFTAQRHPELASRERRVFLMVAGVLGVASIGLVGAGRILGRGRRQVLESRRLLRLDVTRPIVPVGTSIGVPGVDPWQTPNNDFYLIHTAIAVPTIEPKDWTLRIHGLVEQELTLTYDDLVARQLTESWITLNCVSNQVGGDLVGNAWWSGVRIADILADLDLDPSADCILQTSEDGWNCATPLSALTDDRDAMLAVAMNGQPLPIEHGFPVRTIVPGLYGYVSATKWVVDYEVTRFSDVSAFWTERGWSEEGPVKIASRIDVPRSGADVPAGDLRVGGLAWAQHTGIASVEVAVDGEDWQPAELAEAPTTDTWVQWALTVSLKPGDHELRVRAIDNEGLEQTGVRRDVLPDGATGWHTIDVTARD